MAPCDYIEAEGQCVFEDGETETTISVTVKAESPGEDDEFFLIQLIKDDNCVSTLRDEYFGRTNGLAYPHRTGFRPVSGQCHAGYTVHVTV